MAIMAAHHIPYAATVSIAYPDDYMRKVQRAKDTKGFRFMRVLASCPTGWRSEPDTGVHVARLAVQAKFDPLYELIDGERIDEHGRLLVDGRAISAGDITHLRLA